MGYSSWSLKESDTTELLHFLSFLGTKLIFFNSVYQMVFILGSWSKCIVLVYICELYSHHSPVR